MALLPPNATALENALADVAADLLGAASIPIRDLRAVATCPEEWLPWLAWERRVPFWDDDWPGALKRAVVAAAFGLHREKGTVAADRRVLDQAGAIYSYVEGSGNAHHTVAVKVFNSAGLTVGTTALKRAIAQVKRASVHYTVTAEAGLCGVIDVAAGFVAAVVASAFEGRHQP